MILNHFTILKLNVVEIFRFIPKFQIPIFEYRIIIFSLTFHDTKTIRCDNPREIEPYLHQFFSSIEREKKSFEVFSSLKWKQCINISLYVIPIYFNPVFLPWYL